MPVVSSQYWNQVHGNTPEEAKQDLEGMQTMRTLGNNMAWLLKCIAAGKLRAWIPGERTGAEDQLYSIRRQMNYGRVEWIGKISGGCGCE